MTISTSVLKLWLMQKMTEFKNSDFFNACERMEAGREGTGQGSGDSLADLNKLGKKDLTEKAKQSGVPDQVRARVLFCL